MLRFTNDGWKHTTPVGAMLQKHIDTGVIRAGDEDYFVIREGDKYQIGTGVTIPSYGEKTVLHELSTLDQVQSTLLSMGVQTFTHYEIIR